MLYIVLKPIVRLAMLIFCRRIIINKPELLKRKGPLLLACNHPNSFLDATILADLFHEPVHSLARGDVFKKPLYRKVLTALKMLPIYRTSEGAENLGVNYETFDACKNIFKKNGIVLIFSEAMCINEWHLRPLRKGTARLAFTSWDENIPLEVLPVGLNYSSFRRFSKNVFINFGEIMTRHDFEGHPVHARLPLRHNTQVTVAIGQGKRHIEFNHKLKQQFHQIVFEIDKRDIQKQKQLLEKKLSPVAAIILFIPSIAGFLLHAPLFVPLKRYTYKRTWNNDHYDSVLIALLLFTYPFYVMLITLAAVLVFHNLLAWLLLVIIPFTAWAYAQVKPQLDKQQH